MEIHLKDKFNTYCDKLSPSFDKDLYSIIYHLDILLSSSSTTISFYLYMKYTKSDALLILDKIKYITDININIDIYNKSIKIIFPLSNNNKLLNFLIKSFCIA